MTLGWDSAGGMEGRDGEKAERMGRRNCKDSGNNALCHVTPPCSPEIFTEVPQTHKMFNGSVFVSV